MIVYVEDNINNQRLFTRMLEKYDLQIACVDTIDLGYDLIMASEPDLIFVDVHLRTRKTGLDLIYQLRQEGLETPIIVVTAFNMLADRKRALKMGCNGHLYKPYNMQDLHKIVNQFIPLQILAEASTAT